MKEYMSLIRVSIDIAKEVEKRARYRFWKKEEERSNHAKLLQEQEISRTPLCPMRHQRVAWSGPPHDLVESITCLDCGGFATQPEMADRGYDFNDCPDWVYEAIFDEKRMRRLLKGDPTTFYTSRS